MNGPKLAALFVDAACRGCWETLLRLSTENLSDKALFAEAERLVRSCGTGFSDEGFDWLKNELDSGQLLVAEQLAIDPDDPDWQRLQTVLEGACRSLAAFPRAHR